LLGMAWLKAFDVTIKDGVMTLVEKEAAK
jgi:hypothetical protein